jgi:probable rRNA maturation factor
MISFTSVDTTYTLRNKLKIRNWVKNILDSEQKKSGDITYVFCTDEYLGTMNEKYLKHHSLTDIITFDYSEKGRLAGDICISIERVKENSGNFGTTLDEELGRVMAHGILHLAGYKDKAPDDKKLMRQKEDYYLSFYPNL